MKPLSDRRVLVVDDVRANVQLLTRVLQSEYQVSVAFDGESALGSIADSPPDLVLLDIMMPGLDGYEVLRRLRADPGTHELPVMFLSSLEDVGNKAKGFELGANDFRRPVGLQHRHDPSHAARLVRRREQPLDPLR